MLKTNMIKGSKCETPGKQLTRGTPRYAPKYGCCNSINISEKLAPGEEPFADQNIVGDYIIAGGDINGHNYYLGMNNEMAIWWMEDFNRKGQKTGPHLKIV